MPCKTWHKIVVSSKTLKCTPVTIPCILYHRLCMQGQCGHTIYDNTKSSQISNMVKLYGKVVCLYENVYPSLSVFMTKNMPSGTKKHHEHTEPGISTLPSAFLFFSLVIFFRRASSKLHTTFYTEQCTSPLLFHNFEVSRGSSMKNYGFAIVTLL